MHLDWTRYDSRNLTIDTLLEIDPRMHMNPNLGGLHYEALESNRL